MVHGLRRIAALGAAAIAAAAICLPLAGSAASAVTPKSYRMSQQAVLALMRQTLREMKIGSPALGVHESVIGGITSTKVSSLNWSGYADLAATGKSFTSVRAQWKVPTVTCPSTGTGVSAAAFWVGIDGFSSKTVEQDGTMSECIGSFLIGTADWWEMYPTNAVQIVSTVSPGDVVIASVVDKAGQYSLKVTDQTTSTSSFSTTQSCGTTACVNSSSEWIAEAPCCSAPNTVYPLPQFTPWRVISARTTSGGVSGPISKWTHDSITMVNAAKTAPLATPTALNAKGNSFGVKWDASS
jgi:hypothetical protein